MKKIDLHIHTKASSQDQAFFFSEHNLTRYVRDADLDCIAITNHNLFDREQFEKIRNRCSASTLLGLPGFVIDFSMDERREFLHGEYAGDSHDREDRA